MKEIIEAYSPAGCEETLRKLLEKRLRGKFDRFETDNMGNLIAKVGDGNFCIECGMDTVGIMVVSKEDCGVRFAPVGKVEAGNIIGRTVSFGNGASGEVCTDSEEKGNNLKLAEMYIKIDTDAVEIGDFGAVDVEFHEDDYAYMGYGLKNRIALFAVCKAIETAEDVKNITVLFSAQKRLGGRGLRGYFGANEFEGIALVDGCEESECVIVAKDEKAVSKPELRRDFEGLVCEKGLDIRTTVTEENFCLEQVSVSCGDPSVAIGIPVLCNEGEPQRVNKSDFESVVELLIAVIEREGK